MGIRLGSGAGPAREAALAAALRRDGEPLDRRKDLAAEAAAIAAARQALCSSAGAVVAGATEECGDGERDANKPYYGCAGPGVAAGLA